MKPPRASFEPLATQDALDAALAHSDHEPVVLYKHSLTCGLSTRARRQVEDLDQPDGPPIFEIVVQRARPVAEAVERRLGIRHESPQVIVIHKGRPVFDTSHWRITAAAIRTALLNETTV